MRFLEFLEFYFGHISLFVLYDQLLKDVLVELHEFLKSQEKNNFTNMC